LGWAQHRKPTTQIVAQYRKRGDDNGTDRIRSNALQQMNCWKHCWLRKTCTVGFKKGCQTGSIAICTNTHSQKKLRHTAND
jgi:hypothetical protein